MVDGRGVEQGAPGTGALKRSSSFEPPARGSGIPSSLGPASSRPGPPNGPPLLTSTSAPRRSGGHQIGGGVLPSQVSRERALRVRCLEGVGYARGRATSLERRAIIEEGRPWPSTGTIDKPPSGKLRSFAIDSSFLIFFILSAGAVWSVHRSRGDCGQRPHRPRTSWTSRSRCSANSAAGRRHAQSSSATSGQTRHGSRRLSSNSGGLVVEPDWTDFGPAISVGGHRTLSVIGTS